MEAVPRYIYESKEEGFYNFYIENYKNIYFLPDWLSEFIQVRLTYLFRYYGFRNYPRSFICRSYGLFSNCNTYELLYLGLFI